MNPLQTHNSPPLIPGSGEPPSWGGRGPPRAPRSAFCTAVIRRAADDDEWIPVVCCRVLKKKIKYMSHIILFQSHTPLDLGPSWTKILPDLCGHRLQIPKMSETNVWPGPKSFDFDVPLQGLHIPHCFTWSQVIGLMWEFFVVFDQWFSG